MRALRSLLVGIGLAFLALAAGFFFQTAWAKGLWPLPDGRLSYSFMAAILAGTALPLIWVGLAGEVGDLLPEQWLGQITAIIIILGSGALGVYYLMVNTTTRAWALPASPGTLKS